jgi:hypothetical protein
VVLSVWCCRFVFAVQLYGEVVALSKKNSRLLVVGGIEYRWAFSMDSGFATIVVQDGRGSGQRVEATTGEWHSGDPKSITPAAIATLIGYARSQGWDPTASAPPLRLRDIDRTLNLQ